MPLIIIMHSTLKAAIPTSVYLIRNACKFLPLVLIHQVN